MKILDRIPLLPIIFFCMFLGLAPFTPEPHIWEKLKMLASGTLTRPTDIFDFLMHGAPWGVLVLKLLPSRS